MLIEDLFKRDAPNEKLVIKYESLIASLREQLKVVPYYFAHFSQHDASHSEKILEYLGMLLGEEGILKLSVSDRMLMIISCYSHDIGMALEYSQIKNLFSKKDFSEILKNHIDCSYPDLEHIVQDILCFSKEYQELNNEDLLRIYTEVEIVIENVFRKKHAHRSEEQIENDKGFIRDLLGIRCTALLAKICGIHDQDPQRILTLPKEENGFFNDYIHPRLIASLLCLGDLLDMDTDRFDTTLIRAKSDMPIFSNLHRRKHESLRHYLVRDNRIEIAADCDSVQVCRIMRQWVDWIKSVSRFMVLNWADITHDSSLLPPLVRQCEITINGHARWVGISDSKLSIDTDRAIELLKGSNLYRNKAAFVRELVQNAIDASLIQLVLDCERELGKESVTFEEVVDLLQKGTINIHNYDILGYLDCKDGVIQFELTDRGTGIAESEIQAIAGMRGKSPELQSVIARMPQVLKPSGIFGIGLQSAFLVAERIEFYTKTEDEPPKKITIEDPARTGFVYVEDCKDRIRRGTRVVVIIDAEKVTQADLGISDFSYQTEDRAELIMRWLVLHSHNFSPSRNIAQQDKRPIQDYFTVSLYAPFDMYFNQRKFFLLRSMLASNTSEERKAEDENVAMLFGRINPVCTLGQLLTENICLEDEGISYRWFDEEHACLFEAFFTLEGEEKNNSLVFGQMPSVSRYNRYGQRVCYRNAVIENVNLNSALYNRNRLFEILDYRITLYSDRADEILTLDRRGIRETYFPKLVDRICEKVGQMCRKVVDYSLTLPDLKESLSARTAFLIYYLSLYEDYKVEDVERAYSEALNQVEIGNFWDDNGGEHSFPLLKLKEQRINMFYSDEAATKLPKECSENPDSDIRFFSKDKKLNCKQHIFAFRLESAYYSSNGQVRTYKIQIGEKNTLAPEISSTIRLVEFLKIIFNSLRCLPACKDFEILATPLITDVQNEYRQNTGGMIEARVDEEIRRELAEELKENGFVTQAVDRYFERIVSSESYRKNLEFIKAYHKNRANEVLAETYQRLYRELLKTLQCKEMAEFCKAKIEEIEKALPFSMDRVSSQPNYWSQYLLASYTPQSFHKI